MIFPNPKCQELYDGWLLYTKPASRWIQYPQNHARSSETRKAQIAETWELKRRQCDAIINSCRNKGCIGTPSKSLQITEGSRRQI